MSSRRLPRGDAGGTKERMGARSNCTCFNGGSFSAADGGLVLKAR